jgi:hypothetical protein
LEHLALRLHRLGKLSSHDCGQERVGFGNDGIVGRGGIKADRREGELWLI